MKAIKPLRLSFLHRTFDHDRKHHFVATVLVGFDLADPSRLIPEIDLWKMVAETLGRFTVFDHCMWKTRSEVLVSGDCIPPEGKAIECQVGLRVMEGSKKLIDKTLTVFGDRYWGAMGMSPAEPFERMPVDFAHAFGGEKSDWNTQGKGLAAVELPTGEKVHALPNIEDPSRPISTKLDRPRPAGFGPWDMTLPVHFKKMGTYDRRWREEFFPGLAEDIDWSVFNVAAEDQRLDGMLSGDETYRVANMNRDVSVIEGRIPQVQARCFLREKGSAALTELPMRLETLHLFPTVMRGVLIFRGVRPIRTQDATDIDIGVAALEMRGAEQRPMSHYEKVVELRLDRENGYLHVLRDGDLLPQELGLTTTPTDTDRITSVVLSENLGMKNARARMHWELDKAKAKLRELGVDPQHFEHVEIPPEEEQVDPGDPEALALFAEKAQKRADEAREAALKEQADMEDRLRAACREHGLDFDEMVVEAKSKAGHGPPKFSAEGEIARLRTLYVESLASGVPLPHVEEQLDDPKLREKMLKAEQGLHEAYRKAGQFQPAVRTLDAETSALRRAELVELVKSKADLDRRDFCGVDLRGIDLTGANLAGIYLEGSNLEGAKIEGADLTDAMLAYATLEGASFANSKLTGANLGRVKGKGVSLAGCSLRDAVLYEADLQNANLTGAELDGAQMLEVKVDGANFNGTKALRLFFVNTSFKGVTFNEAQYTECAFVNVDLTNADFSRSKIVKTAFLTTKGDNVKFEDAELDNLRVVHECSFDGASFARSKLQMSNFRATPLKGASFEKADISRCHFADCDMTGANLYRAIAVEAHFTNTNLTNARLVAANLMHALLRGTILRGADARGCNLFAVDMSGAIGDDKTNFGGSLVKRVVTTKGARVQASEIETLVRRGETFSEMDLSGLAGRGMELGGAIFDHVSFRNADLTGASLREATFHKCDFTGAKLGGANLHLVAFVETSLRGVNLAAANLAAARFVDVDFTDANLDEVDFLAGQLVRPDFTRTTFHKANLDRTAMMQATIKDTRFEGANIKQLILMETDLRTASFGGTPLKNAVLLKSDLSGRDLSGMDLELTQFMDANLAGTIFVDANLTQCNFQGAIMDRAILDKARAQRAMFAMARLLGTSLRSVHAPECLFVRGKLVGARLDDANLEMCIFVSAICEGASFSGAKLTYADFSGADLTSADFSGATLIRTRFHRVITKGTIFGPGKLLAFGDDDDLADAEAWEPRL